MLAKHYHKNIEVRRLGLDRWPCQEFSYLPGGGENSWGKYRLASSQCFLWWTLCAFLRRIIVVLLRSDLFVVLYIVLFLLFCRFNVVFP